LEGQHRQRVPVLLHLRLRLLLLLA
jgi:hypothetical protein